MSTIVRNHPFLFLFAVVTHSLALAPLPAISSPSTGTSSGGILVKPGDQIVFLGDLTSQTAWKSASGFIHLVNLGLARENISTAVSQAGREGLQTVELPGYYQTKVATLNPKPAWLVIDMGLDEVSRAFVAPDVGEFQANIKSVVDEAKAAGQRVLILTTSIANERGDGIDKNLAPYNDALRALAKSENCPLADVNAALKAALPTAPPLIDGRKLLLNDPTLNTHGQRVVAREILRALGASNAQLAEIDQAWLDAPSSADAATNIPVVTVKTPTTFREYQGLESLAVSKHTSLPQMLQNLCAQDTATALRAVAAPSDSSALQGAVQSAFDTDVKAQIQLIPPAAPASPTPASATGTILVKSGQKIAFMGDSITAFGWNHPYGYVNLVVHGLATAGVQVTPIPAGVGGNTSRDMLARLQKSVLDEKPDWLTLSCGVNDVWHGVAGCDLPTYKKNITSIVDQAQQANIKVMILTATMIQEGDNPFNQKLVAYNDFLRELAKERKLPLADLNVAEHEALKTMLPKRHLAADGVHMNPGGDHMMATGVLKAFGLSDAQLAKVRAAWLDEPNGGIAEGSLRLMATAPITLRESDALETLAQADKQTSVAYLTSIYLQALSEQAKANPTETRLDKLQLAAQSIYAQKIAALVSKGAPSTAAK